MTEAIPQPSTPRKLFFGLFVFPLLIAVGMAVLLCSVVLLTSEQDTPETLIAAIKSGSPSKRWQKAFELSNELNRKKVAHSDAVFQGIRHIFSDKARYDVKTRSYMAIALSHFNKPEAIDALIEAARGGEKEIQLYSLWALGSIGSKRSIPTVVLFLKNEDPELRQVACYILGALGEPGVAEDLRSKLTDPAIDVRWNAALALARLGNDSGIEILSGMFDRQAMVNDHKMSENEVEKVMINAVKGLALLQNPKASGLLEAVSRNEKNLKVRQAAIDAMEYQRTFPGKTMNGGTGHLLMETIAS